MYIFLIVLTFSIFASRLLFSAPLGHCGSRRASAADVPHFFPVVLYSLVKYCNLAPSHGLAHSAVLTYYSRAGLVGGMYIPSRETVLSSSYQQSLPCPIISTEKQSTRSVDFPGFLPDTRLLSISPHIPVRPPSFFRTFTKSSLVTLQDPRPIFTRSLNPANTMPPAPSLESLQDPYTNFHQTKRSL